MSNARSRIVERLHSARLKPYFDLCNENERDALILYRWNLELSSALQQLLSVVEVVLRNAMDRELQAWNDRSTVTTTATESWLLAEPAAPLASLTAGKRRQANNRAQKACDDRASAHPRRGAVVTHDDVLAQITFGMWKELLPNHQSSAGSNTENANRRRLWSECLRGAFPRISDPDGFETFWRVRRLHDVRNRISHMESLLGVDVDGRVSDALQLLDSIDRDVFDWVKGWNPVTGVNRARPRW